MCPRGVASHPVAKSPCPKCGRLLWPNGGAVKHVAACDGTRRDPRARRPQRPAVQVSPEASAAADRVLAAVKARGAAPRTLDEVRAAIAQLVDDCRTTLAVVDLVQDAQAGEPVVRGPEADGCRPSAGG